MYTYALTANSQVIIRSDGLQIWPDPTNTDYIAYLAWVDAGSTATPVPETSLTDAQSAQVAALSVACAEAIMSGFLSSALGAKYTYPSQAKDQTNLASSVLSALLCVQDATTWVADTLYAVGSLVPAGGQIFVNTVLGTSGATQPTWPTAVGTSVLDGGAQWQIWSTPFWCESAAGVWAWIPHSASQIQQVGRDGIAAVLAMQAKNVAFAAQVMAATTVAAVDAVVWS